MFNVVNTLTGQDGARSLTDSSKVAKYATADSTTATSVECVDIVRRTPCISLCFGTCSRAMASTEVQVRTSESVHHDAKVRTSRLIQQPECDCKSETGRHLPHLPFEEWRWSNYSTHEVHREPLTCLCGVQLRPYRHPDRSDPRAPAQGKCKHHAL
jgi:hypothetical protein